jgi:hemolysin activation/secretion protein
VPITKGAAVTASALLICSRYAGVVVACGLCCTMALAQSQTPNAGAILQQQQKGAAAEAFPSSQPSLQRDAPLPRAVIAPSSGAGPGLLVSAFELKGLASADQTSAVLKVLQPYLGSAKTITDLEDAAKDVEVFLQRQGFLLAQVYVPEQRLNKGTVTLQVLLGRIGRVKLEIEPGVKVSPAFLDQIVQTLRQHPVVQRNELEQVLFTLGDLRGVRISSALSPGDEPGVADVTVQIASAASQAYALEADNAGSSFTGRLRLYATAEHFNTARRGDVATLRLQASEGSVFMRGSWLVPINGRGTKLGLAASYLHYQLGSEVFSTLDAQGEASAVSLQLLHPAIRSRNHNLFLQFSTDVRGFEDRVQSINLVTKKSVTSYATLGLVGDFRDTQWGGGISNYTASVITGRLKIRSAEELETDQATYGSYGAYSKLVLTASRLQALPNKDHLFFSMNAQIAGQNLDSSEKMSLGGTNGVRAYPVTESPSDEGLITTWEYRKSLTPERWSGEWVVSVFGDYAMSHQHQKPLATDIGNTRKLMSHGVGLTHARASGWLIKTYVAVRGSTQAQSDDSRARWVFQANYSF